MTVAEMIAKLAVADPNAEIVFAHCQHHLLSVDAAESMTIETSGGGARNPFVQLVSIGWTDDCSCDPDCNKCGRPMGADDIAESGLCIPCDGD